MEYGLKSKTGIFLFYALMLLFLQCANPADYDWPEPKDHLSDLQFGNPETLDILTWNAENFPKNYSQTVSIIAHSLYALDIDIAAFQEINSERFFQHIADTLNAIDSLRAWSAVLGEVTDYDSQNLGFIYSSDVQNTSVEIWFEQEDYFFPRAALALSADFAGQSITIVNNHLKAMVDETSESRRREACLMLEDHIRQNFSDENVLLLGDLNDSLTDTEQNNVFQNFIVADDFYFCDLPIAEGSTTNWSFPGWPSHLDHLLINEALFDEFTAADSMVQTFRIDTYLSGGWSDYDSNVSDHRPVGISLFFE